jgi:hypothetical protein
MKPQDVDKALREIEQFADMKRSVKDSLINFPDHDNVQLFGKWSQPEQFLDNNDAVTRENATANLMERDFKRVVLMESIRSNFIRMFSDFIDDKDMKKNDKNILTIIRFIGDDTTIIKTTSKGLKGWFGQLVITSKRIADVATGSMENAKSAFGWKR